MRFPDDAGAPILASDAVTVAAAGLWQSSLTPIGDPAPAPAGVWSGEWSPWDGVDGADPGDVGPDGTATTDGGDGGGNCDGGSVVAFADAFFFADSPGLPAGSDAAATAFSFVFAAAAEAPADSGGSLATETDAVLGDEAATAPVGSGGVVLPAPNIETSAAAPADVPTGAHNIETSAVAPVDIPTVDANFHVSPESFSIGNAGSGANSSLGPHQDVGVIPGLEFVGPDGPEPVVGPLQTVASSHSSPVESSVAVAVAGAGMTISQVVTNANGSISENVTFAGSGIVFHDTFDAGVSQAYQNCALSAEQAIASQWSNSVTINEEFSAQAQGQNGELASNEFFVDNVSYAALKSALTTLASQEPGDSYLQQAVAHLPSTDPSGGAGFDLALPYARMLGLTSTTESPDDIVTLNTSYNWSYGQDVINTVEHEISEGGMGRIGGVGDQNSFWSVMDLFRYNSSGVPDYTDGRDGQTTFFSYNGGATLSSLSFNNEFNSHGQQVNGGDTADFVQQDVFGTGNPGETNTLSQTDIEIMEALGWDPPPHGPVVTASNVTLSAGQSSVAASSLFTASDPNGESITEYGFMDTGPGYFALNGVTEANNQEIDITAGQLSQLTYQSTPGTLDTLQIRAEDATSWGSWSSFTVTAPPLVIRTDGTTSLTEVGNEYFLDHNGSGPALKSAGADVVAGQFGPWTPIGAVQTATGYDVAWEDAGANEYSIWTTDSSGNLLTSTPNLSATSATLESYETIFNQDLNGDGVIGLTKTVIQTDGSTSLTEVADQFYLYDSSGAGPALKSAGAEVVAGQFGPWTPIGAVQTATGYDVAWKDAGANEYSIWTTDSSGNLLTSTSNLSATSTTLKSYETVFNQDLNEDGVIGVVTTVIRTDGTTSLTEVGNEYFLDHNGSGPALKSAGADVVAGQFGPWTPIGAVQTATGYDVAWKDAGANEYSIWTTDSSGNLLTSTPNLSATSATLESYETIFNQDLNEDGVIGVVTAVIRTDGTTSLTEVGNEYFLDHNGSGPALKSAGADVVAGQFGPWTPIGAVQTATGYDVAWEDAGANEYSIWTTDSSGNLLTSTPNLSATSATLESYEPIFDQNLNGDGELTSTVIQVDGSISLVEVGDQVSSVYYLNNGGSGSSVALKSAGADVVAGQFGPWTPIGAVQTATGYDVAWKDAGANEYSIWTTDSNGNLLTSTANLSATSTTLESYETVFNQDLNGDGVIGLYASPGTTLLIDSPLAGPSGSATIGSSATLEIATVNSASVTFASSTGVLKLDDPSTFTGEIFNFTGNGTLSGSDQIDLRDIVFGAGATASFTGNVNGGTLTVSDAQHHSASVSLVGDYENSTFSISGDGDGGTLIVDPPMTQQKGTSVTGTQTVSVTVGGPGNDTFVFKPHFGSDGIANATSSDTLELDGFSSVAGISELQALLNEAHAGQSQPLFRAASGGQDVMTNLGNHDYVTPVNVQMIDLHVSNLIVHPPIIG